MPDPTAQRLEFADLCERCADEHTTSDRHALYRLARLLRHAPTRVARAVDAALREDQ